MTAAIQLQQGDILIPLGDVIDYGPDSRGVIECLMTLPCEVRLILGNHEEMLLDVIDGRISIEAWRPHGGVETLRSYGIESPSDMPEAHIDFLRTAISHSESDGFIFTHANYYPNQKLTDTPGQWLRWEFFELNRAWPHFSNKTVIVGHTPQRTGNILDLGFAICIDTDASRGGWLTALDTTTGHYWQTNERRQVREGDRKCH
ncbi:metallophosphoesterase family protein [soil metagenome]